MSIDNAKRSKLDKGWLFLTGLAVMLVTLGVIVYPRLKQQWTAPLGPALDLPTLAASPTLFAAQTSSTPIPAAALAANPGPTLKAGKEEPLPSATMSPTEAPQPLCGGPVSMLVLAVGADSGQDYRYGLADVIRIVRVDFTIPKVAVLSMPRDLWVEIPEIENNYGIDHGKLNQAYFYGGPGMGYYKGPGGGPGLLARTLDLNFGLRVDHYGAVNMSTFSKIVDAVGGIDIYLPTDVDGRPVDERTEDMGYFYAGQQHFNGDQALRFSRIRKKYNDFIRMDNQNMVLCALKEKFQSPSVLPRIPQIIGAFQGSVLTDLSPEQISQMACLLPSLKKENLLFTSLPDEILTPARQYSQVLKNETFVLDVDNQVIRDYISQFVAGTWPNEPKEPTCP
jgi:LCP family protein required for cell wall assembly